MYAEVFAYLAWCSVLRRVYLMYTPVTTRDVAPITFILRFKFGRYAQ